MVLSFGLSGCSSSATGSQSVNGTKNLANAKAISGVEGAAVLASANSEGESVVLSTPVNLTELSGAMSTGNGTHSGHQTRIVHTSHGDYVAYISDEIKKNPDGNENSFFNEISIIKVKDGEATVLFQDYISYDSSSISIFADENEEVYASALVSNKFNTTPGMNTGMNLAVWHVDSSTDEVTGYTANLKFDTIRSYGYAQPVIDTVNKKIYALFSGGDEPGYLAWFIFDLETMCWEKESYSYEISERHCYHYAYADGKGGMILVTQRDKLAENAGYPEIPSAPEWSADYVWDQLEYFYFPNMYDDTTAYNFTIVPADYSRVKDLDGDGKRDSDEERQTNLYPGTGCNDLFIDAEGKLHLLYGVSYIRAAYDRKVMEETQWHAVFDISDPANPVELSREQLFFEGYDDTYGIGNPYHFRMAQSTDGTLYIVALRLTDAPTVECTGKLMLYELSDAEEGYDYSLIYKSDRLIPEEFGGLNMTGPRSISVKDNTVSMIYNSSNRWVSGSLESHERKDWYYLTLQRRPAPLLSLPTAWRTPR